MRKQAQTQGPAARWMPALILVVGSLVGGAPLPGECNSAPTAIDDAITISPTGSVLIDVLSNDSDPEGHVLSVTVTGTTCPGTTSVDFGLITFTPEPRLTGNCSISYAATDEAGLLDTATVTVTLAAGIFSDGFESGDVSRWEQP